MNTVLADGTRVRCLQPFEARVIDDDVQGYFTHGITLRPGDTVLDLGANIGLFALRARQRCADLAIYCVEPIPQIRAALAANVGAHATIIGCAIGVPCDRVELEYFPLVSGTSGLTAVIPTDARYGELLHDMATKRAVVGRLARFVPGVVFRAVARVLRASRKRVACERRSVSQLVDHYGLDRISLLKLDIEGCEREALEGIADAHWPRIAQIVAEIHDRTRDLEPITRLLHARGFTVTIGERGCVDDDCCNLYAIR